MHKTSQLNTYLPYDMGINEAQDLSGPGLFCARGVFYLVLVKLNLHLRWNLTLGPSELQIQEMSATEGSALALFEIHGDIPPVPDSEIVWGASGLHFTKA